MIGCTQIKTFALALCELGKRRCIGSHSPTHAHAFPGTSKMNRLTILLLLFVVVRGQLFDLNEEKFKASNSRVVSAALDCVCSPTSRKYAAGARVAIRSAIDSGSDGIKRLNAFNKCVDDFSHEDCINADASFRAKQNESVTDTLCSFVNPSGRNIVDAGNGNVRTVAACDMVDETSSTINDNSIGNGDDMTNNDVTKDANGNGKKPMDPKEAQSGWEGCIAVEHLKGYKLQHSRNLARQVLCSDFGFCATPNHALIVKGQWTSMKRLCVEHWKCVRTVKFVNNLDVFMNRRVELRDFGITLTPYDIRFPRFGVWLVQSIGWLLDLKVISSLCSLSLIFGMYFVTYNR